MEFFFVHICCVCIVKVIANKLISKTEILNSWIKIEEIGSYVNHSVQEV